MADKFASVNVCAMGVDFALYDADAIQEGSNEKGLQKYLSLSWDEIVDLIEGHEKTRDIDPSITDLAARIMEATHGNR